MERGAEPRLHCKAEHCHHEHGHESDGTSNAPAWRLGDVEPEHRGSGEHNDRVGECSIDPVFEVPKRQSHDSPDNKAKQSTQGDGDDHAPRITANRDSFGALLSRHAERLAVVRDGPCPWAF